MNREIKFRAWDGKKIVEPFNNDEYASLNNAISSAKKRYGNLMQFTGEKDKTGNEIYEGDIVEYDKDFQGKPFLDDDGYRFEIGFSCGSFLVIDPYDKSGDRGGFSGFYLHTPALTIIGNIYESPELLKS